MEPRSIGVQTKAYSSGQLGEWPAVGSFSAWRESSPAWGVASGSPRNSSFSEGGGVLDALKKGLTRDRERRADTLGLPTIFE